jgi:hypothetical protein
MANKVDNHEIGWLVKCSFNNIEIEIYYSGVHLFFLYNAVQIVGWNRKDASLLASCRS